MPLFIILWLALGWIGGMICAGISYDVQTPSSHMGEVRMICGLWFIFGWVFFPLLIPIALFLGIAWLAGHATLWAAARVHR